MATHRTFSGDPGPYLQWHREWGDTLYSTDLDLIEYTYTTTGPVPVGLFEYKHLNARPASPADSQLRLIAGLATASAVPAFFVRYTGGTDGYVPAFLVYPMTATALTPQTPYDGALFSERAFAQWLHRLRGETFDLHKHRHLATAVPEALQKHLDDEPPFLD